MSVSEEILESLKRHVRDELYRVHVGGHEDGCPRCTVVDSTWQGCSVIDEYMVERVINTCAVGVRAMEAAANAAERVNLGVLSASPDVVYLNGVGVDGAACACLTTAPTYPVYRNYRHLPGCRFYFTGS